MRILKNIRGETAHSKNHTTGTPTVAMDPNAGFTSEQLDARCKGEKSPDALRLWLAEGVVTWNPWQAGLAVIRARYLESDPEASPPEGVAYSTWSQKLWCDL